MKPDEITQLYDEAYAADYEAKFLASPLNAPDTAYEVELLDELLASARTWLDVGCGTGYFLRRFPHVGRTGIDLSPAMLARARETTPNTAFFQGNFLDDRPEWNNAFDVVSCMWYAYSLVDTIRDLVRLIDNLAAWTGPAGTCFVPLADPALITGFPLRSQLERGGNTGSVTLTAILWGYSEDDGRKVHANLLAPQLDFMTASFERHFDNVRLVRYPPRFEGWQGRPALIARQKRMRSSAPGKY